MATRYRVVKVKGVKPETFIVVGIEFEKNAIVSTSESMAEPAMRAYLKNAGAKEADINSWIEQARNYPG